MALQETDEFLVQRGATPYKIDKQNLMTKVADEDLLVVSRDSSNYKITGLELKGSFGSGSINPGDNDITLNPPALGGLGTEEDPYLLRSFQAAPYGSTAETEETITIVGQPPEAKVIWEDNSVDAGTRFSQIVGVTDGNGTWSGKLHYADIPVSTEDNVYVGKLQIGLVHYQWTVSQGNVFEQPTTVDSVNLIESDPAGDRFTSQSFVASTQVDNGIPTSVKTFDAHVDGTLSKLVQFDEPLESSETYTQPNWQNNTSWLSATAPGPGEDSQFDQNTSIELRYARPKLGAVGLTQWSFAQQKFDTAFTGVKTLRIVMRLSNNFNGGGTAWGGSLSDSQDAVVPFDMTWRGWNTEGQPSNKEDWPWMDLSHQIANETFDTIYWAAKKIVGTLGEVYPTVALIEVNGVILETGATSTALTFATGTDMAALEEGDVVSQDGSATGTVDSITDTTVALINSSGSWINGEDVSGPEKTIAEENARLYCVFDSNGNITDLQNDPQDPPYTTQASNPSLTLTFPATFPSGQTPDEELTEGTTLTVKVTAENSTSTDSKEAMVQPAIPTPPAPLAGLTTLYTGNGTTQSIVNGIDNTTKAMIWNKATDANHQHTLTDTLRGTNSQLDSSAAEGVTTSTTEVTSFNNNGFNISYPGNINVNDSNYVAWNFEAAEGYFDVVEYQGTGATKTIPHNLGTKPGCIIVKSETDIWGWAVYHTSTTANSALFLNNFIFDTLSTDYWNDTDPTATEFTVGGNLHTSGSDRQYIAYLFAEDTPGVIKCGSYTGTGASQFIETGFEPQWILTKTATSPNAADVQYTSWRIRDSKRGWGSTQSPNITTGDIADGVFTISDTGFTIPTGRSANESGATYVYIAIAAPAVRSQTNEEFAETQAKFLTYEYRKQVKEGEDALAKREQLITEAENLGLTKDQINEVFKNG